MMIRFAIIFSVMAAMALPGSAQQNQRRASIVRGGSPDQGKCTVEVEVDGAADVEIRGDQGVIRNLSGQPAVWRRFECTGPVPTNSTSVRFAGVDGRGRMELARDPRNGGAAVVRIEDSKGGREGYTFDLFWGGQGPAYDVGRGNPGNPGNPGNQGNPGNAGRNLPGGRYNAEWAVRTCQDAVRQRASRQFGAHSVQFLNTRIDDNPGRNDWVIGRIDVLHGPGALDERLSFSCSVNFATGRVQSVNLERASRRYPDKQISGGYGSDRAFEVCERAVEERVRRDGYNRVEFLSTRIDDNPGRRDWVIGNIRASRGGNSGDTFTYSCAVDLNSGAVRSVDVRRR